MEGKTSVFREVQYYRSAEDDVRLKSSGSPRNMDALEFAKIVSRYEMEYEVSCSYVVLFLTSNAAMGYTFVYGCNQQA
jgi:hypothetical protein